MGFERPSPVVEARIELHDYCKNVNHELPNNLKRNGWVEKVPGARLLEPLASAIVVQVDQINETKVVKTV